MKIVAFRYYHEIRKGTFVMREWMKEGAPKKNLCRKSQVVHPDLSLPVMVTGRRAVAVLIFSATLSFDAIVHVLRNKASGIPPRRRAERCMSIAGVQCSYIPRNEGASLSFRT
uniref:Uncharacterized protein n=1 Tax=Candidatus Kentrum sp. MB TaxID=2138164 RepID=A0A450XFP5_9GAMM|nr:MAG: hypothetical protein BECKMB1821G_GA0114241_103320 [Candidatus Kentron sp. MB]VFK32939.1 MAG: hypothetical protein BECKMB1821I_GA0114274_103819 [Candidatus Kentron sp. MB]